MIGKEEEGIREDFPCFLLSPLMDLMIDRHDFALSLSLCLLPAPAAAVRHYTSDGCIAAASVCMSVDPGEFSSSFSPLCPCFIPD